MRNRHLAQVVLACLGIVIILSFQGSPRLAQVLKPTDTARNPISAVQAFYKAVERGDWLRVRALTTRDCWNQLEQQGQIQAWEDLRSKDNSLEFTGFSVQKSEIDQKKAVFDGRAVWVSALGPVPRITQTIALEEDQGGWRVSKILLRQSTQTVDYFYTYLSQGQWDKAKSLVQPATWKSLETSGVLNKVKKGLGKKSPYVTAYIKDVDEMGNLSTVKVELVWLNPSEVKLPASLKLAKNGDRWVIRQVSGGWPR